MEINSVYKCPICGNIVELTHVGGGELVCCGKPMELLEEKSSEEGVEKHLPVVKIEGEMVFVNIGAVDHPMTPEHYIEWIECIADGLVMRVYLSSSDSPKAQFCVKDAKDIVVKAYCNIHGLWASKI